MPLISNVDVPFELCCSISLLIMKDPVLATDGVVYERECIEDWFKQHGRSPMMNVPLVDTTTLAPHQIRRERIATLLRNHPQLLKV